MVRLVKLHPLSQSPRCLPTGKLHQDLRRLQVLGHRHDGGFGVTTFDRIEDRAVCIDPDRDVCAHGMDGGDRVMQKVPNRVDERYQDEIVGSVRDGEVEAAVEPDVFSRGPRLGAHDVDRCGNRGDVMSSSVAR